MGFLSLQTFFGLCKKKFEGGGEVTLTSTICDVPTVSFSLPLIHCYVRGERDPTPEQTLKLNTPFPPQINSLVHLVKQG